MLKLRFLFLFICFNAINAFAQNATLQKYTKEVAGQDGLVYTLEGYKNKSGNIIIPADYDFIWPFNNDSLTIARKRIITDDYIVNYYNPVFEYQIISANGYLIHIFNPRQIPEPFSDGTIRFFDKRRRKFGFVNADGTRIVRPRYDEAGDFKEGLAPVRRSIRKNSTYSYINKKGKEVIKNNFTEAYGFSEGIAVVKIKDRLHLCDKKGKLTLVEDQFEEVSDFSSGFAVVSNKVEGKNLFGIINSAGKTVIAPQYEFIDHVINSTAVFVKNNKVGIIDVNTKEEIIKPIFDGLFRYDAFHYLFEENGLQGLMRNTGEIFIPAKYHQIDYYSEGLAAVRKYNQWGFVDIDGNEVIPLQYSSIINNFNGNEALVRMPNKYMLSNNKDTIVLPNYDYVSDVYGYTMTYHKDGKIGFLDLHGDEITAPEFDEVLINVGDIFFGKKQLKDGSEIWSLINSKGKIIVESKFLEVSRFSEGFAAVKTEEGWGFIDLNGVEICHPKYELVRNFSMGAAAVKLNGFWGLINTQGIEVLPAFTQLPDFKEIEDEQGFLAKKDTVAFIRNLFPLFGYEIIGDYDGFCMCVEDLYRENFNDAAICMSKTGTIRRSTICNMYVKEAEAIDLKSALNPDWNIIRIPGKAIRINKKGKVIQ